MKWLVLLLLLPLANAQLTGFDNAPMQIFNLQAGSPPAQHQDMEVQIFVGNDTWFETSSIHEHDGYHVFMTAAPAEAMVVAKADDTYAWYNDINAVQNEALDAAFEVASGTGGVALQSATPQFIAAIDFNGPAQNLGAMMVGEGALWIGGHAGNMRIEGHGLAEGEYGLRSSHGGFMDGGPRVVALPTIGLPCETQAILLDPPGGQYQSNTVIRFAVDEALPPGIVSLRQVTPPALVAQWEADHDLSQISLRLDAGAYQLQHGSGCVQQFTVVAGPETEGVLEIQHRLLDTGFNVDMVAKQGGAVMSHYEYDIRLRHDGALVYAGKLHGHGGGVSFYKGLAEPGIYSVEVFPSPQDLESGWVKTTLYEFEYAGGEPANEAQGNNIPMPLVMVLLALLFAARRKN